MNNDKDIIEKLNEIALKTNWGTVERVNGVPKSIAVIQEAVNEIKRLRELPKEIYASLIKEYQGCLSVGGEIDEEYLRKDAKFYGVELDENV